MLKGTADRERMTISFFIGAGGEDPGDERGGERGRHHRRELPKPYGHSGVAAEGYAALNDPSDFGDGVRRLHAGIAGDHAGCGADAAAASDLLRAVWQNRHAGGIQEGQVRLMSDLTNTHPPPGGNLFFFA